MVIQMVARARVDGVALTRMQEIEMQNVLRLQMGKGVSAADVADSLGAESMKLAATTLEVIYMCFI